MRCHQALSPFAPQGTCKWGNGARQRSSGQAQLQGQAQVYPGGKKQEGVTGVMAHLGVAESIHAAQGACAHARMPPYGAADQKTTSSAVLGRGLPHRQAYVPLTLSQWFPYTPRAHVPPLIPFRFPFGCLLHNFLGPCQTGITQLAWHWPGPSPASASPIGKQQHLLQ